MSFVRKYWIAGLVILLVAIHAVIIGYVRSEATRLKTVASSEIPIGLFYKQSSSREWLTQMRVHLQVPPERRLVARATVEHNRWVVHEAVEEAIRRLDESLLLDPSLVGVKEEITKAVNEALHEELVERIVINDRVDLSIHEFHWKPSSDLIAPGEETHAANSTTLKSVRPVRPTLTEQNAAHEAEHADAEGEHAEGAEDETGHADESHGHSSQAAGHGAPAKKDTHGSAAKPAAHGAAHGAAKPSAHGAAKSSGHAAKKPTSSHSTAKKAKSAH